MENYKTVAREASAEFTERKSRFIGYVRPVKTRAEAEEFIEEIRRIHRQAKHNVYAYVLREDSFSKYSDAGEPSGTAGAPVLEAIKGAGLSDVCVVVTRYFGGILLGTGGLVRAYGKSAKMAIESAGISNMVYCRRYLIKCSYPDYEKINRAAYALGAYAEETSFESEVIITLAVEAPRAQELAKKITDAAQNRAQLFELEAGFCKQNS